MSRRDAAAVRSLPDAMDGRGRVADLLAHRPQAPVRCAFWARFQRLADHGGDFVVANLARRARTRLVVETIHSALRKAIAPRANCCGTDTHLVRDLLVVEPGRRSENNTGPLRQRLRCTVLARQRRQFALLRGFQYDRHRSALRHSRLLASRSRECK